MSSVSLHPSIAFGVYPQREDKQADWLERTAERLFSPLMAARTSYRVLSTIVPMVHQHAAVVGELSDAALIEQSKRLRYLLKVNGLTKALVSEAFALVREVAGRRLGMSHFDVQLVGGWAMLNGMVAEMATGEGKTLTATLPACTAALAGIPVHLITTNDYLAGRDAESMRAIYAGLGLTVGAALADMDEQTRRAAYQCDITYCTNKQVAFDYLRDRIQLRKEAGRLGLQLKTLRQEDGKTPQLILRGLCFAIVDEADSVLVDEAVTPLIISRQGEAVHKKELLEVALDLARQLEIDRDYLLRRTERSLELTDSGIERLVLLAGERSGLWHNSRYRDELVVQALRALHLFEKDTHYLVRDGKVMIVDEFTGRVMADRSWEQGLHQLIEVKESCEPTGEQETIGRISYQRFFRRYLMLGGMSGTVREVVGELHSVYNLNVAMIPANRPILRQVLPDRVFGSNREKWQEVVQRIKSLHQQGRPVLVGTRSVAASEHLSAILESEGVVHRVINARQDDEEAAVVAVAGRRGQVTVATNMAGRGTDIRLEEGVAKLGGLHVIATERHEAGRIDRQLFGRCARQGDPGSVEAIVSMEDELVARYGRRFSRQAAMHFLGLSPGFGKGIAGSVIKRSQQRAERQAARMRKNMQKMDEYLGNVLAFSGEME